MADRGKWGKLCALCCNGLRFVNGRSSGRFSALFEIHPNNRVRSIEKEKKNSLYSSSSLASLSNSTTVHSIPRGAMLFQFSFLFLSRGVSKPGEKRERKKGRRDGACSFHVSWLIRSSPILERWHIVVTRIARGFRRPSSPFQIRNQQHLLYLFLSFFSLCYVTRARYIIRCYTADESANGRRKDALIPWQRLVENARPKTRGKFIFPARCNSFFIRPRWNWPENINIPFLFNLSEAKRRGVILPPFFSVNEIKLWMEEIIIICPPPRTGTMNLKFKGKSFSSSWKYIYIYNRWLF